VETGATTLAIAGNLAVNPLNASDLLAAFGLLGVMIILFAETGLLIGFFFPGDSLLFLAGVAASPFAEAILPGVRLPIWPLLIGAPICAIAGAQLGHLLGARYGRRMFDKPDSRLFRREYVDKAEYYFNRFGAPRAVVLARFIPIVRTFLNPVAGVLEMPARTFFVWNVVGGILWTDGVILAGYFAAKKIIEYIPAEKIDTYLLPAIVLIVLISATPILVEIWRGRRDARKRRAASETGAENAETADGGRHRA
jgi:membrane-associated protein